MKRGRKSCKRCKFTLFGLVFFIALYCFPASATPGTINYYWNLTNTSNSVDYLVIAYDDFYDNVDLYRLAQLRADINSFDVAIVNTSDIYSQFNDTLTSSNDTNIFNFTQFVYENWTKKERVNNDIFVLLVGDTQATESEIDYMPSHASEVPTTGTALFPTDNWYADVNNSDHKPDVYIGRFAVKDNVNLSIIANKTIKYENETTPTQDWLKKMLFINAFDITSSYINNTRDAELQGNYTNHFGFSYENMRPAYGATTEDITNNISSGAFMMVYWGEGTPQYFSYSGGDGFGCSNVPSLTNGDNLTVLLSFTAGIGLFNSSSGESLSECLTQVNDTGAVAVLSSSESAGATSGNSFKKAMFQVIFENNSITWSEAIANAKHQIIDWGETEDFDRYNLLGDPALGIKDYNPPGFSEINASDLTNRQATVTWTTDEASNSTVFYGTTEETSTVSGVDDSVTLHEVTLTGLTRNTLYYYNVSSCDTNGNCNNSWQGTFTTLSNGTINYYWNLTDTSNSADWLVIAHEDFYDNIDLYRLAQHRADSNGFNVGIVNVSDVVSYFNETAVDQLNDTAIKNLIAFAYENWTKNVRTNNDIFVLLVGDVAAEGEIDYMPSHISDLTGPTGNLYLTDNWYADVNNSDRKPDVYIGRFSVKDNDNLSIIANKTIKYENETSMVNQDWLKKINFINALDLIDADLNNTNSTYDEIKGNYTNQFGFSYEDIIPAYGSTTDDITNNISVGRFITTYYGEGETVAWTYSGGAGFGCSHTSQLTNADNLTIILSFACAVAKFNHTSESLGECITQVNDTGVVAFFGATETVGATPSRTFSKQVFRTIFENNSATLGEAIKLAKDQMIDWYESDEAELYNLLGDPALGIKDYRQPDISIAWPWNATVDVADLNFSLIEPNPDSCWYSTDSSVTNASLPGCANTTLSISDGAYNIVLWANDTNGNENISYVVHFVLDTSYPNISLSTPGNESTWSSSNTVDFSYAVTDIGIANCSLIVNDAISSTDENVAVDASESFASVSLSNGAYNWSVNCTDNAGHENNSDTYSLTVSYSAPPSSSGGGGGSSSGSASSSGGVVESVSLVTGGGAGETKTLSFSKDVSVTELDVTLQNKVSSITLSVEKITSKPAETTTPTGNVHSYLKIDKNLNDEDVKNAKIKFKVEKTWLTKNGFLAEEVLLKRYVKGWEALPTVQTKTDKDYAYYEAETNGFSYFAITAEKNPAPTVTLEVKEEEEKPEQPTEEEKIQTPTEPEEKKLNYALYALILVLATLTLILFFERKKIFKFKEKPAKQLPSFEELATNPEIIRFCQQKLKEGYTKQELINAAKQSNINEEKIRKIIEKP